MAARTTPPALIEALESRIAPALVISAGGRVATYTDLDGDRVTVTVSTGRLSASDFIMSSEGATVPGGEELVMLDLSDDGGEFHRATLTIIATPGRLGGDSAANVGFINAADGLTDFTRVKIDGALERIVCGDANDGPRSPGVRLLIAHDFAGSSDEVVGGIARIVEQGAAEAGDSQGDVQRVGGITLTGNNTPPSGVSVASSPSPSVQPTSPASTPLTGGVVKTGAGLQVINSGPVSGGTLQIFTPVLYPVVVATPVTGIEQSVGSATYGYGGVVTTGATYTGATLVVRASAASGFQLSSGTLMLSPGEISAANLERIRLLTAAPAATTEPSATA